MYTRSYWVRRVGFEEEFLLQGCKDNAQLAHPLHCLGRSKEREVMTFKLRTFLEDQLYEYKKHQELEKEFGKLNERKTIEIALKLLSTIEFVQQVDFSRTLSSTTYIDFNENVAMRREANEALTAAERILDE